MKNATTAIALVGTVLGTIACIAISIIVCKKVQEELGVLTEVDKEFSPYDEWET